MGVPNPLSQTLIPDSMDNTMSYSVLNYIKRLKNQAKIDFDRLCNDVMSRHAANKSLNGGNNNGILEGLRVTPRDNFKKDPVIFQSKIKFVVLFLLTIRSKNH